MNKALFAILIAFTIQCGLSTENAAIAVTFVTSDNATQSIASALKKTLIKTAASESSDTLESGQIFSVTPSSAKIRIIDLAVTKLSQTSGNQLQATIDKEIELIGKDPSKALVAESIMVTLSDTGLYDGVYLSFDNELIVSGTFNYNNRKYIFDEVSVPIQTSGYKFLIPEPITVSYDTITQITFAIDPTYFLTLSREQLSSGSVEAAENEGYLTMKTVPVSAPVAGPSVSMEKYRIFLNDASSYYISLLVLINSSGQIASFDYSVVFYPEYRFYAVAFPDGSKNIDLKKMVAPLIQKKSDGSYQLGSARHSLLTQTVAGTQEIRFENFRRQNHAGNALIYSAADSVAIQYSAIQQ